MNHRKAPLPDSMKRMPPPKGICRWCDKPVLNAKGQPTKGTWHPECVKAFKLIHWPAVTRLAVLERDKGICGRCGCDIAEHVREIHPHMTLEHARGFLRGNGGRYWQHDHIRPLVEANGDLSFWQLDNIQTLCSACHVAKGREDNARRREALRSTLQIALPL